MNKEDFDYNSYHVAVKFKEEDSLALILKGYSVDDVYNKVKYMLKNDKKLEKLKNLKIASIDIKELGNFMPDVDIDFENTNVEKALSILKRLQNIRMF